MAAKKYGTQSLLLPVRISSKKMRVKTGVMRATNAVIRAKMKVSQNASREPFMFRRIYDQMLVCCPLLSNFSVGEKVRQTPVKCLRNSSKGYFTGPEPGSFRQALPLRSKPRKTTKCSKFQWMMAGCLPSNASGGIRKPLASRP